MIRVDGALLQRSAEQLRQQCVQLDRIADQVSGARQGLKSCGNVFRELDGHGLRQLNALKERVAELQALYETLEDAAALYSQCEKELCRTEGKAASPFLTSGGPDRQGAYVPQEDWGSAFGDLIRPLLND